MLIDTPSLYRIYQRYPLVTTDTRTLVPGSIYFALTGPRFDGNGFAAGALEKGAAYAVVTDPSLRGERFLHTDDALHLLQELALLHRRTFRIPVIAITGSNGKTTTKEMITSVLSARFRVSATSGNLNNHIGVPLTLLRLQLDAEILICEMGANHPGEIAFLCSMAEPSHGIITNIGKAHLEGFGSLEGVQRAKRELFDYLAGQDGHAFINTDDPLLRALAPGVPNKTTYGFDGNGNPSNHFSLLLEDDREGFRLSDPDNRIVIHSTMFGKYNALNMLAACVVGKHFGISDTDIAGRLSSFIPGANRSERTSWKGCMIIKDAYNANPSSMEQAIRAFSGQYPTGWVVLGDMKELGASGREAHVDIAALALSMRFERIYFVGPTFVEAVEQGDTKDPRIEVVADVEALQAIWNWDACRSKAVLLKGSRSMRLEGLLSSEPKT